MTFRQERPSIRDASFARAHLGIEHPLRLAGFLAAAGQAGGEGEGALEAAFGAAPDLEGGVEAGRAGFDVKGLPGGEADLQPIGAFAEAEVGVGVAGEGEGDGEGSAERESGGMVDGRVGGGAGAVVRNGDLCGSSVVWIRLRVAGCC